MVCVLMAAPVAVRAEGTKTEMVQFPSGKGMAGGFVATPEKPGRYPAVLVIHEWWGLNDWVKEQASQVADQGYAALAVDLYRGKVADTPDLAHELMRGVPEDRAARDLHAAVMNRGTPELRIAVVPDSGTGQLTGLSGTMNIKIADGKHSYDFEYTLPESQ